MLIFAGKICFLVGMIWALHIGVEFVVSVHLPANDNQADVIETQPIVNPATGNAFGSVLESILHKAYKDRAYETGQIIEYEENGVKKHLIWTGNDIY